MLIQLNLREELHSSRIAGSSFLSLCNAMELYTSFENRSHDSYIKLLSKEEGKI